MRTATRKAELLTAAQVAAKLGIGIRTWRRLACLRDTPQPIRMSSRLVRWRETDIDEWISQKEGQPT